MAEDKPNLMKLWEKKDEITPIFFFKATIFLAAIRNTLCIHTSSTIFFFASFKSTSRFEGIMPLLFITCQIDKLQFAIVFLNYFVLKYFLVDVCGGGRAKLEQIVGGRR